MLIMQAWGRLENYAKFIHLSVHTLISTYIPLLKLNDGKNFEHSATICKIFGILF